MDLALRDVDLGQRQRGPRQGERVDGVDAPVALRPHPGLIDEDLRRRTGEQQLAAEGLLDVDEFRVGPDEREPGPRDHPGDHGVGAGPGEVVADDVVAAIGGGLRLVDPAPSEADDVGVVEVETLVRGREEVVEAGVHRVALPRPQAADAALEREVDVGARLCCDRRRRRLEGAVRLLLLVADAEHLRYAAVPGCRPNVLDEDVGAFLLEGEDDEAHDDDEGFVGILTFLAE